MNYLIFLLAILLLPLFGSAQHSLTDQVEYLKNQQEVYFKLAVEDSAWLQNLPASFSIDKISEGSIKLYARVDQMNHWCSLHPNAPLQILPHPGTLHHPVMNPKIVLDATMDWDFYPTYEAYLDLMHQFAENYPDICRIESIGQSEEGRELLMAVISDNVAQQEGEEAQILYTSSIHGDETAGYVLFLRLIGYLLENYGSDPQVTDLIDNLEIWINPLANPDGTYASGNSTVFGATRFNANGVDLNRNYPDPEDGEHPDGNPWQAETIRFMEFAESHNFVLAVNCHGGEEVINYPWDTWATLHADNDWWYFVCREWADTVHAYAPAGYLNGFDNGITNGYQWYSISGGRQDYMNYFHHCREFTLEISNMKLLPETMLEDWWEYNYRSFLNYMEQARFGIHGQITEAGSGNPLKASVFIENHDADESWIVSNTHGYYYRPLYAGTYDLTFFRPGYDLLTLENIQVANYSVTPLDVELSITSSGLASQLFRDRFSIRTSEYDHQVLTYMGHQHIEVDILLVNTQGQQLLHEQVSFDAANRHFRIPVPGTSAGMHLLKVQSAEYSAVYKVLMK